MPTCRVGGQLRVPKVLFEERIGIPITTWPPPELDVDDDPEPASHPCPAALHDAFDPSPFRRP